MTTTANIEVTKNDHIAWILLKTQTLTPGFREDFFDAMDDLEQDNDVRVIVLKSSNPKIFFAGADLKGVYENLAKNDPSVHVDIRSGM